MWAPPRAPRLAALPPSHQKFFILVEFHDARFLVPVRDEKGAIRQPGDVRLAAKRLVGWTGFLNVRGPRGIAGHLGVSLGRGVQRADGLQKFFAVVAENADDFVAII